MFSLTSRDKNSGFSAIESRDNFYQSVSYYPMPFALVTTVDDEGFTSIGPHSLCMPFGVIKEHAMILITRKDSNTAQNIRRSKQANLNFVPYSRRKLKNIVAMGFPGQKPREKMKDNPYNLVQSPTSSRNAPSQFPLIIEEAIQVYECSWDETDEFIYKRTTTEAYFLLKVENILLQNKWHKKLKAGKGFPCMPISYGFRNGSDFWFAKHKRPFQLPVPTDRGEKDSTILYQANRIASDVQFTPEAAAKLRPVPKIFLGKALQGIVKEAQEQNVGVVDEEFMNKLHAKRKNP